jgi:hypothetical protein
LNGVLIIFEPKSEEVIGGWRKLLNDRLCVLYSLLDIGRIVKSGQGKFEGEHILERREMLTEFRPENLNEIIHLEDLGVDVKAMFRLILRK